MVKFAKLHRGKSYKLDKYIDLSYSVSIMNTSIYTTVTVSEARDRFAELVDRASLTGEIFLVEKYGRPRVKITPLDKADKIDPMSLAGVWDNEAGDEIEKFAEQLRKTAKLIRG